MIFTIKPLGSNFWFIEKSPGTASEACLLLGPIDGPEGLNEYLHLGRTDNGVGSDLRESERLRKNRKLARLLP